MLHPGAQQTVANATFGRAGTFRRPLYDSYCFSRLPGTVAHLLAGADSAAALPGDLLSRLGRPQAVVLLLIDGFGWQLLQRHAPHFPVLRRLLDTGLVAPLTAQFPSTTAAHMTALHTGLDVGKSGVHEWYYYEPAVDAVVAPLLFSLAGDQQRETLRQAGVGAADLFPGPTLYQRLAGAGVACTVYQSADYARSTYSEWMFTGALVRPYHTLADGLTALADDLRAGSGRRYHFLYIDRIDHAGHLHGPEAPGLAAEVAAVFGALEEHFFARVAGVKDTLLLLTADHGLTAVDPATTFYVNLALPDLPRYLRQSRQGSIIRFGGSSRDLFLYVRPELLGELEGRLAELLAGRAEVWRTRELLEAGLFGPGPFDRLLPRLGDLVILSYPGQSAFWFEEGRFIMKHRGSHGGLTPEEMEIGLCVLGL
jgi:hypothetical protein